MSTTAGYHYTRRRPKRENGMTKGISCAADESPDNGDTKDPAEIRERMRTVVPRFVVFALNTR